MCNLQRSLTFALVLAAVGCTSASIESSWRSPAAPQLSNVVTLSPAPDGVRRRSVEDKLAQQLTHQGIHAVPAYAVLSERDLGNQSAMIEKLRAAGFDGVVTMRLVDAHQRLTYYPAFNDYWGGAWGAGDVVPTTIVRIEVNAYSLANGQLIWSAMSKSVDPTSSSEVVGDVTKVVSEKLAKDRVIGRPQATMR